MPKILILLAGPEAALADAVAEGARGVRFSEVEVRCVRAPESGGTSALLHPLLTDVQELVPYDAIAIGAPSPSGDLDAGIGWLLEQAGSSVPRPAFLNKVGSVFGAHLFNESGRAHSATVLTRLGELGMITVTPGGSDAEAAGELGKRLAQVAGWITHARSHHHAH